MTSEDSEAPGSASQLSYRGNKSDRSSNKHEQLPPQPTTFKEIVKKWPKQTFLIVSNEFCERFSFYGMRAVLTLYFINILKYSESRSSVLFHAFTVVTYSSPLAGSILADGYIGKFWTIFSVSILYAIGQIILAVSSVFPAESAFHPRLDLLGLLIVAIGTGGIKPCVSAFGGDQFPAHYTRMISIFFSVFYFSINAGSLISMYLTPRFRSIPCLDNDSCYPLAFGIPAVLMIVATLVFMAGSFWYKRLPPKENVIFRVVGTISSALKNKTNTKVKRDHWLEHSLDKHVCEKSVRCRGLQGKCAEKDFVDDVKVLIRVCVMMIPVPMFWALYDQQGSTWVIQAVEMDSKIAPNWNLLPDQMGVLNAFLILFFIPIFQSLVYPGIEMCGFKMTMLRKMAAGGILTALSFIVCGFVQLAVNNSLPNIPLPNEAHLSIINTFPDCHFNIHIENMPMISLAPNSSLQDDPSTGLEQVIRFEYAPLRPNIIVNSSAPNCPNFSAQPTLSGGDSYYMMLTPVGWAVSPSKLKKPSGGNGEFAVSLNFFVPCDNIPSEVSWKGCAGSNETYTGALALCRVDDKTDSDHPCDPKRDDAFYVFDNSKRHDVEVGEYQSDVEGVGNVYDALDVKPGTFQLYYVNHTSTSRKNRPSANQLAVYPASGASFHQSDMGGVYTMTVASRTKSSDSLLVNMHTLVQNNKVKILWQVPQYILLTAGEVMFSITGLEFAYSEASPQLKSVVQAIYLFTTAVGDLIDVIIISLDLFHDLATQMFVFGGLMIIVIVVFILLSVFYYEYADYSTNVDDYEVSDTAIDDAETDIEERSTTRATDTTASSNEHLTHTERF